MRSSSLEVMEESALLSPREGQAIELLSRGHFNKEIARSLCLSENTVKYHLKNAYRKLVIRSRVQAAQAWSAAQVGSG